MEARETIATVGEMTVAQLKAIIFLERIAVNGLLERIKGMDNSNPFNPFPESVNSIR